MGDGTQMRLGLVIVFAAMPLAAHHSTRGAFDDSKLITMQGTVTELQWMNPHGIILMDVAGADGTAVNWLIELPSPNILLRRGLKKDNLKAGDHVVVEVWVARTAGLHRASMRTLTLPDGRVFLGNSGWDNPIKMQ
jgi:hypothetical protein